ncbi:unnamed protein product [Closterium sp. NIES-54]
MPNRGRWNLCSPVSHVPLASHVPQGCESPFEPTQKLFSRVSCPPVPLASHVPQGCKRQPAPGNHLTIVWRHVQSHNTVSADDAVSALNAVSAAVCAESISRIAAAIAAAIAAGVAAGSSAGLGAANMSSAFCHSCPNFCSTCDQSKPFPVGAIIGIVVGAVVVIALFALALYYFFFRRGRCEALVSSKAAAQVCQEYSLAAVVKSTNGWSEANLLGAGAYGDVYRAVSPTDGTTPWAVKRAKIITNDFDTEVCEMATKHHPNLVRLLGFSIGITDKTRVEQILIYELMPNGDLSHWIGKGVHTSPDRGGIPLHSGHLPTSKALPSPPLRSCSVCAAEAATPLSFEQRLHVLVGAARGFEYLHSFPIIHRDIKPANILLDQNMQAKISDFGLVRKGDGNSVQSTRVVGTPGYVDPSYSASNRATTATDVYSFGIVILEVMTGRQAIEESLAIVSDEEATQSKNILASVTQQLAQSGDVLGPGLKDPRMDAQDDLVLKVLQLALRCTAKRSATRPGMGVIAAELEGVLAELIGSKRNAAAEEVDKQILDLTPSADIEKQLARLDAAFDDSEGAV